MKKMMIILVVVLPMILMGDVLVKWEAMQAAKKLKTSMDLLLIQSGGVIKKDVSTNFGTVVRVYDTVIMSLITNKESSIDYSNKYQISKGLKPRSVAVYNKLFQRESFKKAIKEERRRDLLQEYCKPDGLMFPVLNDGLKIIVTESFDDGQAIYTDLEINKYSCNP